jgi:hypothetical protein
MSTAEPRRVSFGSLALCPACLLLAALAFLAWREDCWGDEAFTIRRVSASWDQLYHPFAHRVEGVGHPFDPRFVYDFNPPLYFAVIRLLAGKDPGVFVTRWFSILPALGALFVLAAWCRSSLGLQAARSLILLYALSPAVLYFGHEARPYALPLFLASLALHLTQRHAGDPKRLFAVLFFGSALGCLMNYHLAWWVISFAFVLLALAAKPAGGMGRRSAWAGLLGLVLGSLTAVAAILPQRQMLAIVKGESGPPLSFGLLRSALALPLAVPGGPHVPAGFLLSLAVLALAAALLVRSPQRGLGAAALALWLLPVALPILLHLALATPFTDRYTLFALPGWFLTVGWIAREVSERGGWGRRAAQLVAVACILVCALGSLEILRRPFRAPWQPAVQALLAKAEPGDYYTIDPDWLNICFAVNARRPPPAAYAYLGNGIPPEARRIWIIGHSTLGPIVCETLEKNGWRFEPVSPSDGMWLWRATPTTE